MTTNETRASWPRRVVRTLRIPLLILLGVGVAQALYAPSWVERQRAALLEELEHERGSRVVALIHRQEKVSVLGVPVSTFIDNEVSIDTKV